ncbi:MAG: Asp-tRNA(Asn)/Glu-tRNA(Gln) amidotransferase subunit GatB [Patescibacteria group bacterium]
MTDYKPTIGLEIHAELKTQTKMFCNSKNDPDEKRPNVNVCPVCMGHPGTLPTMNKEAVKHVLRVGVAVGGEIADYTEFDRKNYFYPDIPKGYQISQYAYPLVKGGTVSGVQLTRIHLEEDTARSQHEGDHSLVDFNRAGVPLMELVTEPVIHSAKEAGDFARELQLLLRTLGVSDADMEKGHLRVEVNISVSKNKTLGTKTEIKNINSFRAAEKAIAFEIERQSAVLEEGGEIVQETRGWDDIKGETFSQRKKEPSHDYRYFPEPDLPKLKLSEIPEFNVKTLKASLPELPWQKRERYLSLGLNLEDANMFLTNVPFGMFADAFLEQEKDERAIKLGINLVATNLASLTSDPATTKLTQENFAGLVALRMEDAISSGAAVTILSTLVKEGGDAKEIAEKEGLIQQSDVGALEAIADTIIAENPKVVADYKSGKEQLLQFFVGQGMKATKGAGNPKILQDLFKKKLS